ncbi:MAG: hypothetical protein WCS98_08540 [Bacillota bacterium]
MATKNFKSLDSLQSVEKVINEASTALKSKTNTIVNSAIPETLAGALGAGIGGVGSFAALFYGGSVVGLSAAGISSGLAAAGAVVGGGMVAGIFVLAAPIVVLGAGGVGIASSIKNKKLKEAKDRLLKLAIEKNHAINKALKEEINATKERADYLNSINILLQRAINDLKADLGV